MSLPIHKLLIANRGEIAVRIARACSGLGITSVGVYSDADRGALHVRACDKAYYIGPSPAAESYLRADKIIDVARKAGCDAIHPGFGFLSENADFAQAVQDAGIVWVGPSPEAIRLMGSKIEAKKLAVAAGVPVVPGYFGEDQSESNFRAEAERIGYPVLIKASAGGGGKGMRVVEGASDFAPALAAARREAQAAFGDDSVMLEKYLADPRHIEVQVLGDNAGKLIHLGERECSVQRRHQKVLEESPSPVVDDALRASLTAAAVRLARAAGYSNAGTVEFIYQDGEFFFLEMNTRLQVEHTVTEEALDIDLVEAQLRIAAGERLWLEQEDVAFSGHAMEVRLYAEDPEREFLPSTGTITSLDLPFRQTEVRVDAGVTLGDAITPYYDPMIAKIITSGRSRLDALMRMREVLGALSVDGVRTNLAFLRWLVNHPQVEMGNLSTRFIERYYRPGVFVYAPNTVVLAAAAVLLLSEDFGMPGAPPLSIWEAQAWRQSRQELSTGLAIEGHTYDVWLSALGSARNEWRATVSMQGQQLFDGPVRLELRPQPEVADYFDEVASRVIIEQPGEAVESVEYGWGPGDAVALSWEKREYIARAALPLSTERLDRAVHLADEDSLESPMPGKVLRVLVSEGEQVEEEQPLVIIEAMKMEFTVRAPHKGGVLVVKYREGDQVAAGDVLIELEKGDGAT